MQGIFGLAYSQERAFSPGSPGSPTKTERALVDRSAGRPRSFDVRVSSTRPGETTFNNLLSKHVTMNGAWAKAIAVLTQWAQSQGAVAPGTTISIVDTHDGGKLFTATYLGFEPNLLSERRP